MRDAATTEVGTRNERQRETPGLSRDGGILSPYRREKN